MTCPLGCRCERHRGALLDADPAVTPTLRAYLAAFDAYNTAAARADAWQARAAALLMSVLLYGSVPESGTRHVARARPQFGLASILLL